MRFIVLALLAANLLFFAWTQGWLDTLVGVRADAGREPERLARQVRPDLVRVLPLGDAPPARPAASAASSSPATPSIASACLQAGPFAPGEIGTAEAALRAIGLLPGHYASLRIEQPGVWLVYMGRFAGMDAVQQKIAELQRLQLPYEELAEPPELAPGLALGRYESKAAAEAALAKAVQRGVRSARVAPLAAPSVLHVLRVERVDAPLERQLLALGDAPFAAHRFEPCSGLIAAMSAASAPASAASPR